MKTIYKAITDLGFKKIGKDVFGQQMFEKNNTIIYIHKMTFKPQKELTFKQRAKMMYSPNQ